MGAHVLYLLGSVWMMKESERKERVRKDYMWKEKE
jgi:hypothetical protein